jgi:ABC-2 type transport system permease protein
MRTIYILWLRQIKKHFRSPSRLFGSLGQPVLYLVAFGFGFNSIFEKAGAGNYIQFLAPGVVCLGVLFNSVFSGIEVLWDRQFGFLKETLVAPVSRINIMLGRTLGGATIATMQGIIVFIISYLVGFRAPVLLLVPAILIMFVVSVLFTALGTALGSRLQDMQGFGLIVNLLIMPLFFLSGALFPLDNVPRALEIIAHFNPLAYGIDGIRTILGAVSHFGLGWDIGVLAVVAVAMVAVGAYMFAHTEA